MNFHSWRTPTDALCTLTPVGPRGHRGQPKSGWISVLALMGVVACGESTADSGGASSGTNPSPVAPPSVLEQRLTSGATALTNLSSRIGGLRAAVMAQPGAAALRGELVVNLLTRAQFVGSFTDLGESLALAAEGQRTSSELERAIQIEASALGAVHEFERAIGLLASVDTAAGDATLGNLQLARGDDPRPIEEARRALALESPSFSSLSDWAIALAAVGEFAAADAAYADALRNYRDVSPLPVAWVAFQRGVMWAERAGEPARGRTFYEEATRALPQYVAANVHLAEIEASEGEIAAAQNRLARLVEAGTEDPEPYGLLAEIVADEAERDQLRAITESRYLDLIERFPKAFLDHGAEFFMVVDPDRALDLALENLEHRTDDRAYQIVIEAALAADVASLACDAAREATLEAHPSFVRPSVPLRELAEGVLVDCE